MHRWWSILLVACAPPLTQGDVAPWAEPSCHHLFGAPGPNTGLPPEACRPEVTAGDAVWSVPPYRPEDLAELRRWSLDNPPDPLAADPYTTPDAWLPAPAGVCGWTVTDRRGRSYRLDTFATQEDAWDAGATVTHGGACGACSSLEDLAVYIETPDLTTPVRQCGLESLAREPLASVPCLKAIGFTDRCAEIWAYNTAHTREVCLDACIRLLSAPYHAPDGSPNACIQCDEERSGPVFKAVAGRTRRNSGLPTALCRPCEAVWRIDHRVQ
jgi:hypothetical protein